MLYASTLRFYFVSRVRVVICRDLEGGLTARVQLMMFYWFSICFDYTAACPHVLEWVCEDVRMASCFAVFLRTCANARLHAMFW